MLIKSIIDTSLFFTTGFNPKFKENVDVNKMVMIGTIDFSDHTDMYETFKSELKLPENIIKRKYVIFDEVNHTVWFCWCEGSLIR